MNKKIFLLITVCLLAGILSPVAFAKKHKDLKFNNPIALQRADPHVFKDADGTYYFVATVPEYDRIEIRKSKTINGLSEAKPEVIWRKHEQGAMGNHIWAPEIHRIEGKWYIYFAAGSAENKWAIRIYALSNSSKDPLKGSWHEEGQIKTQRDEFALDATTFELNKQRYMLWSDRASRTVTNTGLYIAKMQSPLMLTGPEVVISQPEYDWEMHTYRVNEAPAVLVHGNKIFVTYSASATDATYCLGMLWADIDADLLNPASWHKLPNPVFYTKEEFKRFGPGHNCFTKSEDGKTDVMIYHARDYKEIKGESLYDPNRATRARVLKWNADGTPDFQQDIQD